MHGAPTSTAFIIHYSEAICSPSWPISPWPLPHQGMQQKSLLPKCFIHSLEKGDRLSDQYRWPLGLGRPAGAPAGSSWLPRRCLTSEGRLQSSKLLLTRDISFSKVGTHPGLFKELSVLGPWGEEERPFLKVLRGHEMPGPAAWGYPLLLLSLTGTVDSF